MKVMPRQYVVDNTKEAMHHPHLQKEEDLEDVVVEEALLKRRTTIRTTSDDSTLTTVSSTSSAAETNGEDVSATASLGEAQEHDGKNSVYFDENEEMWKCRHCAWNHQNGFPGIDHTHPIHSHFATGGAEVGWPQYNVKADDFAAKLEDADIHKVLSTVINGKEDGITSSTVLTKKEPETSATSDELEESDEEVVELEFETAVEKMHTHTDYNMYCPNCSNRITKVVLRRKIRHRRVVPVSPDNERRDLVGCLSCFSIFVSCGNRLNPFPIFAGEDTESTPLPREPPSETTQPLRAQFTPTSEVTGWRFDLCWPFRKERGGENALTSPLLAPTDEPIEQVLPAPTPPQESTLDGNVIIDVPEELETPIPGVKPPIQSGPEINGEIDGDYQPDEGDVRSPVEETPVGVGYPALAAAPIDATIPLIVTEPGSSRPLEVVKSVVYGGLMESITSLSVVSSAAASDATTLNIVALGLANLVGGLVVLAHNLKDLRYGDSSPASENRYKEHLGKKEHFIMHATVAVLSYIVFGLLPPAVYGFTFRESDDRDYKMLAVAVASFLCIVILAIAKAYARREHTFAAYSMTVLYYVTSAAAASGVAFVVGDLANKLVERLGWLNPPAKVGSQMFLDPKSLQPTWASY